MKKIVLTLSIAFLVAVPLFAQGIPDVPPPTPVNPDPFAPPPGAKCVEFKEVVVQTYQCGTEYRCWTDKWGQEICADVPKYCKETITDCARWE